MAEEQIVQSPGTTGSSETTSAPAATPAADAPWYSTIEDATLRGTAELKGWKTPADAVKAYKGVEKLVGADPETILKLPKDLAKATPEELQGVYAKLGLPAKPEDYQLPAFEGDDSAAPLLKGAAGKFHELGLNQRQAQALVEWFAGTGGEIQKASEQAIMAETAADVEALKSEWPGEIFKQRIELASRGAALLQLTEDEIESMELGLGTKRMMMALADLGEKLGEHKPADDSGGGSNFGMTPAAAQVKKDELMADKEWAARYRDGKPGSKEWNELERLNRIILAGQI